MIATLSKRGDSVAAPGTELNALPEILTTREGAKLLRCSKAHFCNLLNGIVPGLPRLPYLQLGRRRLVRKMTLLQWMEEVESDRTQR